jgi:hypothetical protein
VSGATQMTSGSPAFAMDGGGDGGDGGGGGGGGGGGCAAALRSASASASSVSAGLEGTAIVARDAAVAIKSLISAKVIARWLIGVGGKVDLQRFDPLLLTDITGAWRRRWPCRGGETRTDGDGNVAAAARAPPPGRAKALRAQWQPAPQPARRASAAAGAAAAGAPPASSARTSAAAATMLRSAGIASS